ncbi:ATP-binding protein [Microbacterium xanthum]|uniref:ATP-binding protein n=1 Tax=Microbacterium xanthum TaxID=3079794 RepID=UPI002AD32C4B|nr:MULTISPECIES: ATP-binding protein [unclassified Microbacterium]MDZ8173200.1 ATP-binding protein [Microbacterium sp. KSW-48]MDZ8200647.1 ATP-binding protein [Microbacterium sp. SSW1-59]
MAAELPIGTLLESVDRAPAHVLARKLNRHTFWCGQSGSGKTYALGVLLEQVMLETELPLVILDPNSDFVRLGEMRAGAHSASAEALRSRDVRVLGKKGDHDLKVQFTELPLKSKAAVAQIDPILDAEEYNQLLRLEDEVHTIDDRDLVAFLRGKGSVVHDKLANRLENLGITEWDLWAWGGRNVGDHLDETADATVLDLGGFPTPAESRAAALAVLDHLWARREERIGRLIVIDEAHNLCRPDPATPVERLLTERIVQIAAEGRKYGLWLLLSTQRPSKVHINALSQCDNLALMRMSSPKDLAELGDVFGYAPASMLERSSSFTQGQALFAGGFVDSPVLVQMGARITEEGGSDVAVPLR